MLRMRARLTAVGKGKLMAGDEEKQARRMIVEMADTLEEEPELELDDERFNELMAGEGLFRSDDALDRSRYFRELLRLQSELVKLQDTVATRGMKVVVLFEGRDAAGKGGVIKRITQRLNPRVCRVVALTAPS